SRFSARLPHTHSVERWVVRCSGEAWATPGTVRRGRRWETPTLGSWGPSLCTNCSAEGGEVARAIGRSTPDIPVNGSTQTRVRTWTSPMSQRYGNDFSENLSARTRGPAPGTDRVDPGARTVTEPRHGKGGSSPVLS